MTLKLHDIVEGRSTGRLFSSQPNFQHITPSTPEGQRLLGVLRNHVTIVSTEVIDLTDNGGIPLINARTGQVKRYTDWANGTPIGWMPYDPVHHGRRNIEPADEIEDSNGQVHGE